MRDVSWSEDSLDLVTTSWDGAVVKWSYSGDDDDDDDDDKHWADTDHYHDCSD